MSDEPKLTDEQLAAAILRALPIDHEDHTTVVRIGLNEQTDRRHVVWGRPEWLTAEIVASIRAAEEDCPPLDEPKEPK